MFDTGTGSKELRLKGGGVVDFPWDDIGLVCAAQVTGSSKPIVIVNIEDQVLVSQAETTTLRDSLWPNKVQT